MCNVIDFLKTYDQLNDVECFFFSCYEDIYSLFLSCIDDKLWLFVSHTQQLSVI